MKKKKKFIIPLLIFSIIALFIAVKIFLDFDKETKLKSEVIEITNVIYSNNTSDINEILDRRIIKSGPYSEVEKSIKLYYKNLYVSLENFNFLIDSDNFTNYLSGKNLNEDKPSFIKSKNNLQNSKAQIEDCYSKFINTIDNQSIKLETLVNKDIKKYYGDFYLELTKYAINEEQKELIDKEYKETIEKITIYNEAFDFLATNKGHWAIQNDAIVFDDTIIYDEYVNITKRLNSSSIIENETKDNEVSES